MISEITIDNKIITVIIENKTSNLISKVVESIKTLNLFENITTFVKGIKIIESKDLIYDKVSQLVNLLVTYDFLQDSNIVFTTLVHAWQNLKSQENILCGYDNVLNYEIEILNNSMMSLIPLNPKYKNLSADQVKELINSMKLNKLIYSTNINVINIFMSNKFMDDTIKNILNILVKNKIIDTKNKSNIYNKIMLSFFKMMAKDEINNLYDISNKSIDHPLSKYKDIAENLESLLHKVIHGIPLNKVELSKLQNAITKTGEFTTMPEIITKNLNKLPKTLSDKLNKIIHIQ